MKKKGYYEKKLAAQEAHLSELMEQKQLLKLSSGEVEKILISPFSLQKLIREQDRSNQKLLKMNGQAGGIYAEKKKESY